MSPQEVGAMVASLADVVPELIILAAGIAILLYSLFAPLRMQAGAAVIALAATVAASSKSFTMLGV